jgi:hypothetical protein
MTASSQETQEQPTGQDPTEEANAPDVNATLQGLSGDGIPTTTTDFPPSPTWSNADASNPVSRAPTPVGDSESGPKIDLTPPYRLLTGKAPQDPTTIQHPFQHINNPATDSEADPLLDREADDGLETYQEIANQPATSKYKSAIDQITAGNRAKGLGILSKPVAVAGLHIRTKSLTSGGAVKGLNDIGNEARSSGTGTAKDNGEQNIQNTDLRIRRSALDARKNQMRESQQE